MNESQPPPLPVTLGEVQIAGFWRRLFAFVIDNAILGVPAALLGFALFDQFAKLGGWGRAVGFMVALLYFGLMNSALGGGQTLGKRLMKIRVVNSNDSPISVARSSLRFLILGAPFFLNGAAFPPRIFTSWIGIMIGFVIFGIGGTIIYLFVFNRRNRRALHDLISGTFVVKTNSPAGASKANTWGGHYVVIGLVFVVCLVAPIFLKPLAEKPVFKDILSLQSRLMSEPNVWQATVISGKSFTSNATGTHWISSTSVTLRVNIPIVDDDAFASSIARILLDNYPELANRDRIVVVISYGYDIGIAWASRWHVYNLSRVEWEQRIPAR
jgi:uncharacterized RDD family membrane protein YckC